MTEKEQPEAPQEPTRAEGDPTAESRAENSRPERPRPDEEAEGAPTDPPPERPTDPEEGARSPRARKRELTVDERRQILDLRSKGYGSREIARRTGIGRRVVRRTLEEAGLSPARPSSAGARARATDRASKLDGFREAIAERVAKGLTSTRILREIGELGYAGGHSILRAYVRSIRPTPRPRKSVHRRFETDPALEAQCDWSPYLVSLGGESRRVHALSLILAWSRKVYVRFFLDERQPTLFEGLDGALRDFGGVTDRIVFDRMATVILGRIGSDGRTLWHPRLVDFASYYDFEPFDCNEADPDRKGKKERFYRYMEDDFVKGSGWESLEALNAAVRVWLDDNANARTHGTTGRVPDEAWREERPLLRPLPDEPYPYFAEETRRVGPDSVVWVRGTPYTVPAELAHRTVAVRLFATRFQVLDPTGRVVFERCYVPRQDKGKLVIDPSHYASVPRRSRKAGGAEPRIDEQLRVRFPELGELVDGIRARMKSIAHVHLRELLRLAERYGDWAFLGAAKRAQSYRRHDANAVRRLLEQLHPLPPEEDAPAAPLGAAARATAILGDVESGSLEDYADLDVAQGWVDTDDTDEADEADEADAAEGRPEAEEDGRGA